MPQSLVNPFLVAPAVVTPDSVGTPDFWWKADSFALADGTAVGGVGVEWQDQSTNNRDGTQGTAAARPTFRTNIFGTMPSIRFDGSDDALEFPVATFGTNTALTLIWVGKGIANVDGNILGHNVNSMQLRVYYTNLDKVDFFDGAINVISDTFGTTLTSNVKMITWKRYLNAGNYVIDFRENKTARGVNMGPAGGSCTYNRIGRAFYGAGSTPNVEMGELIGYPSALTDAQLDSLYDTYFKPRWGLP